MPEISSHTLQIDGRWDIRDLYVFPHRYAEVYSFLYALSTVGLPQQDLFAEAFERIPVAWWL